jgi:hypothetical protein
MIATSPVTQASNRAFYLVITVASLLVGAAIGSQLLVGAYAPPPAGATALPLIVEAPPPAAIAFAQPPPPLAAPRTAPTSCERYIAAVEDLIACDQVPQAARDAARQGIEAIRQAWGVASLAAAARASLDEGCRAAADAVDQTTSAMSCPINDRAAGTRLPAR